MQQKLFFHYAFLLCFMNDILKVLSNRLWGNMFYFNYSNTPRTYLSVYKECSPCTLGDQVQQRALHNAAIITTQTAGGLYSGKHKQPSKHRRIYHLAIWTMPVHQHIFHGTGPFGLAPPPQTNSNSILQYHRVPQAISRYAPASKVCIT